jgi:hypothetical protein
MSNSIEIHRDDSDTEPEMTQEEPEHTPVIAPQIKSKKVRSEKQIAAFEKAQKTRIENKRLRDLEKSLIAQNKQVEIKSRDDKRAAKREHYSKLKEKHMPVEPETESESEEEVVVKKKKKIAAKPVKKKKKVVIYVSSDSESESESEEEEEEYIAPKKSRIKRKEPQIETQNEQIDYNSFFV